MDFTSRLNPDYFILLTYWLETAKILAKKDSQNTLFHIH